MSFFSCIDFIKTFELDVPELSRFNHFTKKKHIFKERGEMKVCAKFFTLVEIKIIV